MKVRGRSKYGAKRTTVDGITFASAKEARRYAELKLLEKAGKIRKLRLQPAFDLCAPDWGVNLAVGATGHPLVGVYRADFEYEERERWPSDPPCESWRCVVEDVKGFKTPLYRWKKRHVEAQYGIQIRET